MHLGFSSMNTPQDPAPALLAKALEERGFESLWYGEHSHIPRSRNTPYPAGGDLPELYKTMMDPYVSLAIAAGATTRLRLATGIALLMERELMSQAKTLATLDRLSEGRVLVGTGVGWNREEFENVNRHPWNKRYSVMKETVAATRALWTESSPEYRGEFVQFDPVWFEPKPRQQPGPPILFGAMGPLGMKHAAQWADGWMPVDIGLPNVNKAVEDFRALVRAAGRDPAAVPITVQTMITPTLDKLREYRDVGIERVIIGVAVDGWDKPEQIMPMLDRFARLIPTIQ
jgi:probable F420-dependent oxidoreductase